MKRLFTFIMPGGILVLASVLIVHTGAGYITLPALIDIYPYIVYPAAVLVGWRFNRSSLVFAAVVLAIADRTCVYYLSEFPFAGALGRGVFLAVGILLPVNLAALCLAKERGIFTRYGIVRIGLLSLQGIFMALFLKISPARALYYLEYRFIEKDIFSGTGLSQPVIAAFVIASAVVLLRFVRNQGARESGFFWVLMMCLICLLEADFKTSSVFYFSTAGLILCVSIIESSYAMAFRDELTGLPARRALKDDLLKLGSRYSLAMLDIDHFKKFNDRYGHDVGDQVLRMVASRLSNVSGGGRAYRYGGEEFTLIFPGKYADDAAVHLEDLRKDIESSPFVVRGRLRPVRKPRKPRMDSGSTKRVSVTVSIGMALRDEDNPRSQDVLKAADKALYKAKKAGRNRLCA